MFHQESEWEIEKSSVSSMKFALVIVSGSNAVLLLFGGRVGGMCD